MAAPSKQLAQRTDTQTKLASSQHEIYYSLVHLLTKQGNVFQPTFVSVCPCVCGHTFSGRDAQMVTPAPDLLKAAW